MNNFEKIGIPKDILPTLSVLKRVAEGERVEYDIHKAVKDIGIAQYYLLGYMNGLAETENISEKIKAVTEASELLKELLDIVTGVV